MKSRKCVICGEEFQPKVWNRSVCYKDHYHRCPVCGEQVLSNDPNRQSCTCSRKCGQQQGNASRMKTNLQKYGVDNVSKLDSVRANISEKLSAIHPKQPKRYKECEVCGKIFELQWPYTQHTCSPACRGKYRQQTGISKAVYEKACITNMSRYGTCNPGEREDVRKKMADTMEERYGVRYARHLPEIEEKVRQTNLKKYGVPYYLQTEDANRSNTYRISKLNQDFQQFLLDNGVIDVTLEKYVDGKFYDIAIGDSILIELNPTYTHNIMGNHWDSQGLDVNYHSIKSQIAQQHGYRCIHVFDWDNWDKILDLVKPCVSIGARSCTIQQVDKATANKFTSQHHLQGKCNGQNLNYGLYQGDSLVAIMTFGRPRYNQNYDFELLRFCSKSGTQVRGGASKLFHQFTKDNPTSSIISYCDLSKFTGDVYVKIGMKCIDITAPAKVWSKGNKKVTQNLLNQRGYDQLFGANYGKGTSNEQLMIDAGWLPVYDCGQAVYIYNR